MSTEKKRKAPTKKKTGLPKNWQITKDNFLAECEKYKINPDKPVPLQPAEEMFCRLFFRCHNKSEAARYAWPNQKAPQAYSYIVWKKPEVRLRLAQLWYEERKRLKLDPEDILQELARIGSTDLRDIVETDEFGNQQLRKNYDGRAVKSITPYQDDEGRIFFKVDMWNKEKAIELYGKYHKMFTENIAGDFRHRVDVTISEDFAPNGKKPE